MYRMRIFTGQRFVTLWEDTAAKGVPKMRAPAPAPAATAF
jgi:hypothetical protein